MRTWPTLVTGAGSGIGLATVVELARRGHLVLAPVHLARLCLPAMHPHPHGRAAVQRRPQGGEGGG